MDMLLLVFNLKGLFLLIPTAISFSRLSQFPCFQLYFSFPVSSLKLLIPTFSMFATGAGISTPSRVRISLKPHAEAKATHGYVQSRRL
uniref:Uncharacterized protein n=1 Tax=Rhizophora mucronata TaxID=61149 RepID=A0A2P2JW26_RHIMU